MQDIEKVYEDGDYSIYECSECSKQYSTATKMFQHLEDKHDVKLEVLPD